MALKSRQKVVIMAFWRLCFWVGVSFCWSWQNDFERGEMSGWGDKWEDKVGGQNRGTGGTKHPKKGVWVVGCNIQFSRITLKIGGELWGEIHPCFFISHLLYRGISVDYACSYLWFLLKKGGGGARRRCYEVERIDPITLKRCKIREMGYSCSSYSSVFIGMNRKVSGLAPFLSTFTVRMSPMSTA